MWEDFREYFGNHTSKQRWVRERASVMQLQWEICWSPTEPWSQEASSLHPSASNQWTPAVPWEHLQPWVISSLGGGIPGEGLNCEQPAGNSWNECLGREEGIWGMHYGIHDSPIKTVGPQELCQQPGTIV